MDENGTSVSGDLKEITMPSTWMTMRTKLFTGKNNKKIMMIAKVNTFEFENNCNSSSENSKP